MTETLWMVLTFVAVSLVAWLILAVIRRSLLIGRSTAASSRSGELLPGESREPGAAAKLFAAQLPMNETERSELRADLRNAGYYEPHALITYAAIRGLLVLIPIAITAALALSAPAGQLPKIFLIGAIGVICGFGLPRFYLLYRSRTRRREMEKALPFTVDLLRLCLSAGQNLLQALGHVADKLRFSHPTMAREVAITHQQAEIHSLDHALHQWADRCPHPEGRNLALLLVQSERLGTDVASTLGEFSSHFRTNLKQRAEARASRTSFWMLLPCVYCLLPASVIILVGPAYQEFLDHTQKTPELFQKARQEIDRVNRRERATLPPATANVAPTTSPTQR
jgi:tight adherence protein C